MATIMRARLAAMIVAIVLSAEAGSIRAQQTFHAGVALVPVEVRVVDRQGRPVTGLTKDHFIVSEDGVKQTIAFFEPRTVAEASASASGAAAPSVLLPGETELMGPVGPKRRVFLIALERAWLPEIPFAGVQALTRFLRERLTSGDYAAISAFGRITDLTNDHRALAEVVDRLRALQLSIDNRNVRRSEGIALMTLASAPNSVGVAPMSRALDAVFAPASAGVHAAPLHNGEFENVIYRVVDETWAAATRNASGGAFGFVGGPSGDGLDLNSILTAVNRRTANVVGALQYLRYIDGEKHLVYPFVGPSFLSFDSDRNIARLAADARVSIDFIKANGLDAQVGPSLGSGFANFDRMYMEMSFKNVASISGGQVFLDRYPDEAYAGIDAATRTGYVLAYTPSNGKLDDTYRSIKVEVRGVKDVKVLSRQSYKAAAKPDVFDPQQYAARDRVLTAAYWPGGLDDLGVKASATVGGRGIVTDVRLDFTQVSQTPVGSRHRAKLEVAAFVSDRSDRPVGAAWETLDLDLTDQEVSRVLTTGFMHRVTIPVTDTARLVKVVVYDYGTGRAGSTLVHLY